jgi:hypothetical protein
VAAPRSAGKSLFGVWIAKESSLGTPLASGNPLRVWLNSQEDHLASVLRPRLEVAGADLDRVTLTSEPWRLPGALETIRAQLVERSTDLLILDSLAQHIPRYQGHEGASVAMRGLVDVAEQLGLAVVLLGNTVKGGRASVEAAIGGAGVVQNLAKAIFILGPDPASIDEAPLDTVFRGISGAPCRDCGQSGEHRDGSCGTNAGGADRQAPARLVVACERFGVGPLPSSLLFEMRTTFYEPTGREEPFLQLLGESDHTASQVFDAQHKSSQVARGEDHTRTAEVALWLRETLVKSGPTPTERVIAAAKRTGTYPSRNTFDRARKLAGVEAIRPSELQAILGIERHKSLDEAERRSFWIHVPDVGEPPVDAWADG